MFEVGEIAGIEVDDAFPGGAIGGEQFIDVLGFAAGGVEEDAVLIHGGVLDQEAIDAHDVVGPAINADLPDGPFHDDDEGAAVGEGLDPKMAVGSLLVAGVVIEEEGVANDQRIFLVLVGIEMGGLVDEVAQSVALGPLAGDGEAGVPFFDLGGMGRGVLDAGNDATERCLGQIVMPEALGQFIAGQPEGKQMPAIGGDGELVDVGDGRERGLFPVVQIGQHQSAAGFGGSGGEEALLLAGPARVPQGGGAEEAAGILGGSVGQVQAIEPGGPVLIAGQQGLIGFRRVAELREAIHLWDRPRRGSHRSWRAAG